MRIQRVRAALSCLMVAAAACGSGSGGGGAGRLTVGAVTFAENQIVAEMYAQILSDAGYDIERRFNFQNRESLRPALNAGSVDLAPEYLSSLLTTIDPSAEVRNSAVENVEALEELLAEEGLAILEPSSADNANAIVVRRATANQLDLERVSDLAAHNGELTLGGPPECPQRRLCLRGLREVYGIDFGRFVPLDAGGPLTIAALESGEIDVALLFSTSGVIRARDWVMLEDDRDLQAAENITPVIRQDALDDEVEELLNSVSEVLTTQRITELNGQVEVANVDFRQAARAFLKEQGLL